MFYSQDQIDRANQTKKELGDVLKSKIVEGRRKLYWME